MLSFFLFRLPLLFLVFSHPLFALLDLNEFCQDFVLQSKQIKVPNYPDAFNPSMTRWQGQILLCFRSRDPLTLLTNVVCITKLDENYDPIGKVYPLKIERDALSGELVQDPRLIVIDERLYIVYSNTWRLPAETVRRVFVSELYFDGDCFVAYNPEVFLRFDGIKDNKFEKNWVPFEYNGNLLLAYTINPHKIFFPIFGKKRCLTIANSEMYYDWQWGELRGGTQAFVVNGRYLAFFHSSKMIRTVHSFGKLMTHYFMGAYTFEAEPPFALTHISSEIIVEENFYKEPYYQTWKPLRVVFPCGYICDKNTLVVSFGRQDHEMWIVKIDKEKLFDSLIPVEPKE